MTKTKFTHKLLALIMASVMMLSTVVSVDVASVSAAAALPLPASLEAPKIILYDESDYHTNLFVRALTPTSVLDFYEKAQTHSYLDEKYNRFSDYGEWCFDYWSGIQVDWKIDNGSWQYQSVWDSGLDYSGDHSYDLFDGGPTTNIGIGSSWYGDLYGIVGQLADFGCLTSATDGENTYYRFDSANHKISVRARYVICVRNNEGDTRQILSPWSSVAEYGKGNRTDSTAVSSLSAPTIANFEIYETNYDKSPATSFDVYYGQDVMNALLWSDQFDSEFEYSNMRLLIEASLDSNFDADSIIVTGYYDSPKRHLNSDGLFTDLWYELPDRIDDAFYWGGETVYLRAKWSNDRTVNGEYSYIESPYSNVLSVKGPKVGFFDVTVTHEPYGFDSAPGRYSESYKITDGREYNDIYCAPLEGCYVDTIKVNGTVMYDHDDTSTHGILDRWDSDCSFAFLGEAAYATQDLDIVITYAGTPSAKYGITTEWGEGGFLTSSSDFYSWNNNSLVVYHGATPEIDIRPDPGYEIDRVVIDGVENAQAKADASYTFPQVTDNTHRISVTFKRVSYRISSSAYHGTISADYPGYDSDDYVKIGDDITFTFEPDQDISGHYYGLEGVFIDGVRSAEAEKSGSYTFAGVNADHSIEVVYSDDPVITHDITATSGANGSISPEGKVHVHEGNGQTFYFFPDKGYEVDKVTVDGVEITNLVSKEYYTVPNVREEHTISVTFKKAPVPFKIEVISGGDEPTLHTVNPAGTTPVWEGNSFTVTYSPFTGYEVEKVLVDSSPVTADGTYTLSNVTSDHTVEIIFKVKSYSVTFTDYDGTVLKTETVEHGKTATPPATPVREHYVFDRWDADYSGITARVTVKALYVPAKYTVKFIGWDGAVLKSQEVEYSQDATAPDAPEREGYAFSNWSRDYTAVDSDIEVTAVYVPVHTVHKWVDKTIVKPSTATTHGERTFRCEECGEIFTEEMPFICDLNKDNAINSVDVVLYLRYIAQWELPFDTDIADANGDGKYNTTDVIFILRFIAGWDVILGGKK